MLFGDAAVVEGFVAFGGEGVGVEGDKRVFGAVFLQAMVEGEEAGKVCRVCDERRPYCACQLHKRADPVAVNIPFFALVSAGAVARLSVILAVSFRSIGLARGNYG